MSEERKKQLIFDINNDGIVDALTDGLLYMRYLFGLTGDSLTEDLVTKDAARTTADEIEAYLTDPKVQELLDLDNDGTVDALTDGMMVLRYAFGLTGDSVTEDVISATAKEMGMGSEEVFDRVQNIFDSKLQLDDEGKIYTEDGEIPFIERDGKKYETSNITTEYQEPEPEPEPEDDGVLFPGAPDQKQNS